MGRRNKQFTLYKFRTMVDGADKIGPAWTEKNDTRVTPLGRVFRYTHLDEIPQLVNILRGDISFTGPRPESAELAEKYSSLPYYDMRHSIAPGITGWAQINFKPSASVEEAYEKLRYDIFYIKNRSFFFDTLIMMRTVKHFFFSHE
jgi:lipopolysaccharide/colanic/teichoic acid biosynthesis glycosyltransferase